MESNHRPLTAAYKNGGRLQRKYLEEELSTSQIGKICEVSSETIRYRLQKLCIPRRSSSEAFHIQFGNRCNLSLGAIEWIQGELLGDGNLNSKSPYSAQFAYASKYLEYIEYVRDTLELFGIEQMGKICTRHHIDRNMNCYTYSYRSRRYEELLPIHKRWYPEGKKIVPRDLKLVPLILRQFYIGDGCLTHSKRGGRRPCIYLATCGFPIPDVQWLVEELIKLGFRATRRTAQNTIGISVYSTKDFLEYIGDCPVECYQYKWNYLGRN